MKKATVLFFCLLIGGYHLFIFCSGSGIPIPLDVLTTSSIILIFGISTIFTTISITLTPCIVIPFASIFQDTKIYCEIFREKTDGNRTLAAENRSIQTLIQSIKNYAMLFSSTIATLVALVYYENHATTMLEIKLFFIIMIIEILISSLAFQLYLLSKKRIKRHIFSLNKKKIYLTRFLTFICITGVKLIWLISMSFAALWALKIFKIEDNMAIVILLILTTLANCIFLIAETPPTSFQRTAETYSRKSVFIYLVKSIHPLSVLVLIFITVFSLAHPSFVKETSAATLRMLKIGGGIELTYYFNRNNIEDLPREIVDACKPEVTCTTKKLNVIIDMGKVFYVKSSDGIIYSLPREKLQPIMTKL